MSENSWNRRASASMVSWGVMGISPVISVPSGGSMEYTPDRGTFTYAIKSTSRKVSPSHTRSSKVLSSAQWPEGMFMA